MPDQKVSRTPPKTYQLDDLEMAVLLVQLAKTIAESTPPTDPDSAKKPAQRVDRELEKAVLLVQLAKTIAESKPPTDPDSEKKVAWRADYQTTVEMVKLLTDIRFRCLVFVTAIIAIANALLPNTAPAGTRIAFGLVGLLTTLGIAVYELRNSQIYESAFHRARALEGKLCAEKTSKKAGRGLFGERPPYVSKAQGASLDEKWKTSAGEKAKLMRFLFVKVKHDQGLALIYGAVLGGWSYLIAHGILSILALRSFWAEALKDRTGIIAGIVALLAFLLSWRSFVYHDNHRLTLQLPQDWKTTCSE